MSGIRTVKARDLRPGMLMQDPRVGHIWARLASVRVGRFGVDLASSQFSHGGHTLFVSLDSDCRVKDAGEVQPNG